jgi:regulatory protein
VDEDAAATLKRLRLTALRTLTRRDYGTVELQRKLEQKGFATAQVREVLGALRSEGLLNDDRFAESAVRQHVSRGHGPIRIRAELRMQGLPNEGIEAGLRSIEVSWAELARDVRRKRFGTAPPRSPAERAKQGRFLQYRGFDSEQIRAAFRGLSCDDSAEYSELQDEDAGDRDLDV